MAKVTTESIFDAARQVLAEKGFEKQVFDWRVSEHTSKFR